jgi:hypothetical protein
MRRLEDFEGDPSIAELDPDIRDKGFSGMRGTSSRYSDVDGAVVPAVWCLVFFAPGRVYHILSIELFLGQRGRVVSVSPLFEGFTKVNCKAGNVHHKSRSVPENLPPRRVFSWQGWVFLVALAVLDHWFHRECPSIVREKELLPSTLLDVERRMTHFVWRE